MMDIEEIPNLIMREVTRQISMIARPRHLLVTSYDSKTNSIKGTFEPDNMNPNSVPSGWLPLNVHGASKNGISVQVGPVPGSGAQPGDLALVLHAEGDPEAGMVLGFLHNDVDQPPGAKSGQHIVQHNPTGVQRLLHALGHFITAPKLASSVISQTITHFAQDTIGDNSANISHTADNNITHTSNKGNITHTAHGNITHTAGGDITHTATGNLNITAGKQITFGAGTGDDIVIKPTNGKLVYLGGDPADGGTFDFVSTPSGPSENVKALVSGTP